MAEGKSKTGVVKKRASKREKKDWIAAYIFIAPVTLGLLVFYIWPFIQNIWFSFNEVSKFNVATFCGLANYQKLFHDGEVLKTFGNTLKYVVVTVPVGLFLSILIAALLNSKIKGTSIYRTLYFLPSVTMAAAVCCHGMEMDLQRENGYLKQCNPCTGWKRYRLADRSENCII